MNLEFRDVRSTDYVSRFGVGAANRLAPRPEIELWECIHESQVVGHCDANRSTGEIIGLSVLHEYQRRRAAGNRKAGAFPCRQSLASDRRATNLALPRMQPDTISGPLGREEIAVMAAVLGAAYAGTSHGW